MVDDNSMGLQARKQVLEEVGYRVSTSATPEEAFDRISTDPFDVLVTDFKMPGMNGDELIRRIRENGITTPVILLSGFAEPMGLHEANTGADVVLQKSANEVNQLVRAVRNVLRLRKPPGSSRPSRPPRKKAV